MLVPPRPLSEENMVRLQRHFRGGSMGKFLGNIHFEIGVVLHGPYIGQYFGQGTKIRHFIY